MDGQLIIGALMFFIFGLILGFSLGVESGFEKNQKEAVAVGAGKFMMTGDKTMKFEWAKPSPDKVEKP